MIEDNALVLIIGIAIGVLLCIIVAAQVFAFLNLKKQIKELFANHSKGVKK